MQGAQLRETVGAALTASTGVKAAGTGPSMRRGEWRGVIVRSKGQRGEGPPPLPSQSALLLQEPCDRGPRPSRSCWLGAAVEEGGALHWKVLEEEHHQRRQGP